MKICILESTVVPLARFDLSKENIDMFMTLFVQRKFGSICKFNRDMSEHETPTIRLVLSTLKRNYGLHFVLLRIANPHVESLDYRFSFTAKTLFTLRLIATSGVCIIEIP